MRMIYQPHWGDDHAIELLNNLIDFPDKPPYWSRARLIIGNAIQHLGRHTGWAARGITFTIPKNSSIPEEGVPCA